ncbi:glucose-1-phosphate thymidylyltransferase [bacterium]|jgi:UDP-N-acetylglucosamine diphosphorylase / glucose-1-phosphate thymidylyltransferase / UDP-N-acetylgalactosamine diphosphorylase / glucosamine-1-phosphate N-acetyltransferase / galactosamine-1-phosphate N-acetyltransferase|nr:glucose-1-phosphate thymidylyltransferase [bacterium]
MRLDLSHYLDLEGFPCLSLFEGVESCYEVLGQPLKDFCAALKGQEIHGKVMPGAVCEGDGIFIGEGSCVEPGAYIKGPCWIGSNTQIRHTAYLRGNVVVGDECVVGHATEVKNSIFLNKAKAGHFAYVGDSVLGVNVNLGAGTKLANLKVIPSDIILSLDGEKIPTGLRKLGAILGNGTELGCNSVTSPGTILAPFSIVYPAISIKGAFSKKKIFKLSNMVMTKRSD